MQRRKKLGVGDALPTTRANDAVRVERNHASQRSLRAQLKIFCVENGQRALRRRCIVNDRKQQARVFSAARLGNEIRFCEIDVRRTPGRNDVATCNWRQAARRRMHRSKHSSQLAPFELWTSTLMTLSNHRDCKLRG